MSEYIKFKDLRYEGKTVRFAVVNVKQDIAIGTVRWYGAWRKYCFFPDIGMVFDTTCLNAISEFIQQLMENRKNARNERK